MLQGTTGDQCTVFFLSIRPPSYKTMVLCTGKNPIYKTMVLYCTIFLELGIQVPNILSTVLIDKIAVCNHNFIDINHIFR